jgi:hypothetical protein
MDSEVAFRLPPTECILRENTGEARPMYDNCIRPQGGVVYILSDNCLFEEYHVYSALAIFATIATMSILKIAKQWHFGVAQ